MTVQEMKRGGKNRELLKNHEREEGRLIALSLADELLKEVKD